MKPVKIRVWKAMKPALISQITQSQNGIQIQAAQNIPQDLIRKIISTIRVNRLYLFLRINVVHWRRRCRTIAKFVPLLPECGGLRIWNEAPTKILVRLWRIGPKDIFELVSIIPQPSKPLGKVHYVCIFLVDPWSLLREDRFDVLPAELKEPGFLSSARHPNWCNTFFF